MFEEINGIVGNCRMGKKRKLEILSADENLLKQIPSDVERQYRGGWNLFKEKGPDVSFKELNITEKLYGLGITFGKTSHSVSNYWYRFWEKGKGGFAISGDGAITNVSKTGFRGVDFLIHEAFNVRGKDINHASIEEVADYAVRVNIPKVAIVHMNRAQRKNKKDIEQLISKAETQGIKVFLPNDHDSIII